MKFAQNTESFIAAVNETGRARRVRAEEAVARYALGTGLAAAGAAAAYFAIQAFGKKR